MCKGLSLVAVRGKADVQTKRKNPHLKSTDSETVILIICLFLVSMKYPKVTFLYHSNTSVKSFTLKLHAQVKLRGKTEKERMSSMSVKANTEYSNL